MLSNESSQRVDHARKTRKVFYNLNTNKAIPGLTPKYQDDNHNNRQPSKLELLRAEYQRKILKEKEAKLIQMYEDNQKKAMIRINKSQKTPNDSDRISVREFFNERRRMEANGVPMPPIHNHYLLAGSSSSLDTWSNNVGSGSSLKTQKTNFGRDRLQPLAPIQRPHQTQGINTTNVKTGGEPNPPVEVGREGDYILFSGNTPFGTQKSLLVVDSRLADKENNNRSVDLNISSFRANFIKLAHQSKSLSEQQPEPTQEPSSSASEFHLHEKDKGLRDGNKDKLTDFQKWRMKQTLEGRLKELNVTKNSNNNKQGKWEKLNDDTTEDFENNDRDKFVYEDNGGRTKIPVKMAYQQKEFEKIAKVKELEVEDKRRKEEQVGKQVFQRGHQNKFDKYRKQEENKSLLETTRKEWQNNVDETQRKSDEKTATREVISQHTGEPSKRSAKLFPNTKNSQPIIPKLGYVNRAGNDNPSSVSKVDEQANVLHEDQPSLTSLAKCQLCGRSFLADRLEKHQAACAKVNKQRKEFDSSKKRVEGTDLVIYAGNVKRPEPPKKKSNWRAKHEEFINSLRYAKKVTQYEKEGKDVRQLTPPEASKNPDYVPCPHCGRSFNQTAAERHIPRCQSLKTRPPPMNTKRR